MRRRGEGGKRGPYRKTLEAIILYLLKKPYATTREIIRETGRENHAIVYGLHHLEKKKIIGFKPGKQNRKHWFITNTVAASSLIRRDTEFQTFLKTLKLANKAVRKMAKQQYEIGKTTRKIMKRGLFSDLARTICETNETIKKLMDSFGRFYEENQPEIKQLDSYYRRFGVKIGEFEVGAFVKLVRAYKEAKKEVDRLMLLEPSNPTPLIMLLEVVKDPSRLLEFKQIARSKLREKTYELAPMPAKCPLCGVSLDSNQFCQKCGLDVLHYESELLNRPQPLKPVW